MAKNRPIGLTSLYPDLLTAAVDSSGNVTELPADFSLPELNALIVAMELYGVSYSGVLLARNSPVPLATLATPSSNPPVSLTLPPLARLPVMQANSGSNVTTSSTTSADSSAMQADAAGTALLGSATQTGLPTQQQLQAPVTAQDQPASSSLPEMPILADRSSLSQAVETGNGLTASNTTMSLEQASPVSGENENMSN